MKHVGKMSMSMQFSQDPPSKINQNLFSNVNTEISQKPTQTKLFKIKFERAS